MIGNLGLSCHVSVELTYELTSFVSPALRLKGHFTLKNSNEVKLSFAEYIISESSLEKAEQCCVGIGNKSLVVSPAGPFCDIQFTGLLSLDESFRKEIVAHKWVAVGNMKRNPQFTRCRSIDKDSVKEEQGVPGKRDE